MYRIHSLSGCLHLPHRRLHRTVDARPRCITPSRLLPPDPPFEGRGHPEPWRYLYVARLESKVTTHSGHCCCCLTCLRGRGATILRRTRGRPRSMGVAIYRRREQSLKSILSRARRYYRHIHVRRVGHYPTTRLQVHQEGTKVRAAAPTTTTTDARCFHNMFRQQHFFESSCESEDYVGHPSSGKRARSSAYLSRSSIELGFQNSCVSIHRWAVTPIHKSTRTRTPIDSCRGSSNINRLQDRLLSCNVRST